MNTPALTGAILIGLSLGLTGAGGSILTLPVLVYLAGLPPNQAVGPSLLIVGVSALMGAIQRFRSGGVHLPAAGMFVASGAAGALAGARLTHLLRPEVLMWVFAGLMVLIAARMLLPGGSAIPPEPECKPARCLAAGLGVGVLTGFLGVGGGFLLMPALMKFARLPLKTATGTSLAVISCNSAAGFLGHLRDAPVPWSLTLGFTATAAAGVWLGGRAASRLPEALLKRAFAVLVLLTAAFTLWKSL